MVLRWKYKVDNLLDFEEEKKKSMGMTAYTHSKN